MPPSDPDSNDLDLNVLNGIRSIIVAEDQAVNLHLIRNQITLLGLLSKTTFCKDGEEAINTVNSFLSKPPAEVEQPITVMLLDFQMPKKNGLEVVEAVR